MRADLKNSESTEAWAAVERAEEAAAAVTGERDENVLLRLTLSRRVLELRGAALELEIRIDHATQQK